MIVKGRLRGMARKRKRVNQFGSLGLQDRISRIDFGSGEIYTKSGIIGVKVLSGQIRERRRIGKRIRSVRAQFSEGIEITQASMIPPRAGAPL